MKTFLLSLFLLFSFMPKADAAMSFVGPVRMETLGNCSLPWNVNVYHLIANIGDNNHYQTFRKGSGAGSDFKTTTGSVFCVCGIRFISWTAADDYGPILGYSTTASTLGTQTTAPTGWIKFDIGLSVASISTGMMGISENSIGKEKTLNFDWEVPSDGYPGIATLEGSQGINTVELLGEIKAACH